MVKPEKGALGKRKPLPVDQYLGKKVDVRVNGSVHKGVVVGLAYEYGVKKILTKLSVRLEDKPDAVRVKPSKVKTRSAD